MKRKKNAEAAQEMRGALMPRLLNEEQASIYLGLSVSKLRSLRPATPLRFTAETFAAALEKGEIVPIPYLKIGGAVRYDTRKLDAWIDRQFVIGRLPSD
ncbi:MAG: hypothetical protein K5841_10390 [Fretibacterium sp.]|nr:hypothetical protein [Fretibacterium sp.]